MYNKYGFWDCETAKKITINLVAIGIKIKIIAGLSVEMLRYLFFFIFGNKKFIW